MNDRELLELAAKAAGYMARTETMYGEFQILVDGRWWRPLEDDGDALRLANKLVMSVEISEYEASTYAYAGPTDSSVGCRPYAMELWRDDRGAATRRAITRAAAEIGRAMKDSA